MKKGVFPHFCFLGCGAIAQQHARMLKKLYPSIHLSFASRETSKAVYYKTKCNGHKSYGSYEEALKDDSIDIVFITTPHAYHAELAVLAAEHKKHIIVEKPATRTLQELEDIYIAVEKNNVRFTVAENYYYKPFIKVIREYVEKNYIGKVLFIELTKTNKNIISGWRTNKELMGGGALLEGGIHWISVLLSLVNSDPKSVIAFKPDVSYETNIPFEDTLMLNIQFENGIIGKLTHSWSIPNPFRGVGLSKIYGTQGTITFESNGLFVWCYGKKNKIKFISPFKFLGFQEMLKSFIEGYITNKEWQPSFQRINSELKVIHAAYHSLESQRLENI